LFETLCGGPLDGVRCSYKEIVLVNQTFNSIIRGGCCDADNCDNHHRIRHPTACNGLETRHIHLGVCIDRICDNRLSETPRISFIEPQRIEIQSSAQVSPTKHATTHNKVNDRI